MLDASTLQRTFTRSDARDAVRSALLSLATGAATLPDEIAFALPDGEIHVKGAYLGDTGSVAFKVASGFPGNPARGVPANGGFSVALDPITGLVKAFLLDGGWLTDMRTAAAAAVAADLLARADSHSVALIGTGAQAAFQLAALRDVRDIQRVRVWNRHADRAAEFADAHSSSTLLVEAANTVEEAVADADIVVTLTASRSPLVRADWLGPGTHVTAVGADMVGKQELSADVLVADRVAACSLDD